MAKKTILILSITVLTLMPGFGQSAFKNPVIPGFYPDPSICRVGDDYYLATSSFQFWPGIPVLHSKNLVDWTKIGYCITRREQIDLSGVVASDGLWAPTLRYNQGVFYMIVSMVQRDPWNPVNFYVTATDPAGPWSDPIIVETGTGIDPDLFFDDDGKVYYSRNDGKGIVAAEIDISTGELLSDFHLLWGGTGWPYIEAQHIYKKGGYYYLLAAEGGTGPYHRSTIARSHDVLSGYKAYAFNPILSHLERFMHPIQGTGHGDLIEAHDGSWWFVFLAKRSIAFESFNSVLGRETFLAPVSWTADGWPIIGNRGHVEEVMTAPSFYEHNEKKYHFLDHFEKPAFDLEWNFIRNPVDSNYSLTEKPGSLVIYTSPVQLDDQGSPSFAGIRQKHHNFEATTSLVFSPQAPDQEAGICVYMEEKKHYTLGITRKGNQKLLNLSGRVGNLTGTIASQPMPDGKIYLRITGNPHFYRFYYSVDNKDYVFLGELEASLLEPPQYTGCYIGLFAAGLGRKKALFDWIDYTEVKP